MFYTRLIKNVEVWEFVTKVPLVAKKYSIWELRAKRKVLFKAMENNLSDQIQLDEVSA